MENWFNLLKKIDEKDKIISISVRRNQEYFKGYEKDLANIDKAAEQFSSVDEARTMLDYDFYDGCGGTFGPHFTAWSAESVYFPHQHDGCESIRKVPRNPCCYAIDHDNAVELE